MNRFIVPLAAFAFVAASVGASGAQPDKGGSDLQQQAQRPPQASQAPVQPQSPSQPGAQSDQQSVQIESKALIGSMVSDRDGKNVGKVTNLLIDPKEGKIKTVVISMGGRMGMGGKEVAVPWSEVQLARDQNHNVVVSLQHDVLEAAPARDSQQNPSQKK